MDENQIIKHGHKEQEIWKPIPGFSMYAVSTHGRVRREKQTNKRLHKGLILSEYKRPDGYISYQLQDDANKRIGWLAHRLVLTVFVGTAPTQKHEVAHGDGNKSNNHISNLRWATKIENAFDKRRHGTHKCGEDIHHSVLTEKDVSCARHLYDRGLSYRQLGEIFDISPSVIGRAVCGSTWKECGDL